MGWLAGIPLLGRLLGMGETAVDRLIPDKNKAQDQAHEGRQTQAATTLEGERARNYFTPRAIVLYAMGFAVIYGIVLQPFAVAFGLDLPPVDFKPALQILLGLFGLGI